MGDILSSLLHALIVRVSARYDLWGGVPPQTLKHNTQDNQIWHLTFSRGFVCPKMVRILPMNLSWKVVASAPIFAKYADRGAYLIDLKDVYCPDGKCSVLHGNVYMYADSNHLTNVYEATLTDIVYERAFAAGWDPKGITRK